ncbi:hypothetical protein [Vulcanisaeta distributa]|uniref:Uncharacterized protein n=1 Tax=Vulcanisaeta distributa (strain DSM 14429 / JCM 11212 / NBRC 100878 / IC-017) TaxID=572478 RepID=E1QSR8_VULDI|nr:hypothetical protein [Vulcanisaeta distributa]ADN49585.1 conserved hypothetical protein [Vulcanisaeta distributa DSM 14429]
MAECTPRIREVRYWDEAWWEEGFKGIDEAYSRLRGLLDAVKEVELKLTGSDLSQLLRSQQMRDFTMKVILGGFRQECVNKTLNADDVKGCFNSNALARFYREVFGIGLSNDDIAKFVNVAQYVGLEKAGEGLRIVSMRSYVMDTLNGILTSFINVYKVAGRQVPNPMRYNVDKPEDLAQAFIDTTNALLKLLPLYNPFTFFIQSLDFTPKPYLRLMYCDKLFSSDVTNLMAKYGIRLTTLLKPSISKELDEELAIIGHEENSLGRHLLATVWHIYELTYWLKGKDYVKNIDDEFRKYVEKYSIYLDEFYRRLTGSGFEGVCSMMLDINIYYGSNINIYGRSIFGRDVFSFSRRGCGEIRMSLSYSEFLELFSPLMFLGLIFRHPLSNEIFTVG